MALVFTEHQWLYTPELQMYKVTQKEIDNADRVGFIKRWDGVELYVQRFI